MDNLNKLKQYMKEQDGVVDVHEAAIYLGIPVLELAGAGRPLKRLKEAGIMMGYGDTGYILKFRCPCGSCFPVCRCKSGRENK